MIFIIEDPVEITTPKNAFVVEVTVMHGDADKYETIQIGPFTDEQLNWLEQAIIVTRNLIKTNSRKYDNVEGYDLWFSGCLPNKYDYRDPIIKTISYLPNDCTCDGCCKAGVEKYEVYYYDENNVKYHVSYKE